MTSWIKLFTDINVLIFKTTRGRLGSQLGRQSVLLLNTIGRKTGKNHTTTLAYYRDGNNYLLVATNWGKESHPGWFYNLMQSPRTTIQVGASTIQVEARIAEGDEYQRLWQLVTRRNKQYIRYQKGILRQIPIVILTPVPPL